MACALARSEAEVKGSRCPGMMWEESRMTLKTSILVKAGIRLVVDCHHFTEALASSLLLSVSSLSLPKLDNADVLLFLSLHPSILTCSPPSRTFSISSTRSSAEPDPEEVSPRSASSSWMTRVDPSSEM